VSNSHLSAIPTGDVFSTGGFTVDPGQMATALRVPDARIFVLTDVIVFPVIHTNDPNFDILYHIEEHSPGETIIGTGVKFQFIGVGTGQNWSQHFTGGIKFGSGKDVVVSLNAMGYCGFQAPRLFHQRNVGFLIYRQRCLADAWLAPMK